MGWDSNSSSFWPTAPSLSPVAYRRLLLHGTADKRYARKIVGPLAAAGWLLACWLLAG